MQLKESSEEPEISESKGKTEESATNMNGHATDQPNSTTKTDENGQSGVYVDDEDDNQREDSPEKSTSKASTDD